MIEKVNGVLMGLNPTERHALKRILAIAETHMDEVGPIFDGDDDYWRGEGMCHSTVAKLAEKLREAFDLNEVPDPEAAPKRDVEKWRRDLAHKRNDHFVNSRYVRCSYDRCHAIFRKEQGQKGHVWTLALKAGWQILDHKFHKPGEYNKTLGVPSSDLVCSLRHDKHGCPIYTDNQDCVYWPNWDQDI